MFEFVQELWPYIEKAGTVASAILALWLYRSLAENDKLRKQLDECWEKRLVESQTRETKLVTVIEQNTQSAAAQVKLIGNMIGRSAD